ncbi:MAG TPA: 2OG-Fe(II) oxygenase family protein [Anaeromyxobacter sp.]
MDERDRPEVIRLFPSFVWKARLGNEDRAAVRAAILEEVSAQRGGAADPEPGQVWQSRHGLHRVPALEPLVRHLRLGIEQVLAFLHVGSAPFEITGMWVNVAAPGGAVRMHNHPNNFLSGVYYVQVHEGADTINFHDPRPQTAVVRPPVSELTAYNTDQVVVRVEEGALLVFPSWLVHSVDPNRSDRMRISASFNAMFSSYAETMGGPLWGER